MLFRDTVPCLDQMTLKHIFNVTYVYVNTTETIYSMHDFLFGTSGSALNYIK